MRRLFTHLLQPRTAPGARWRARPTGWPAGLLVVLLALLLVLAPPPAAAQRVDLTTLRAKRGDNGLELDYNARLSLSPSIEEALQRGVPLYFVAEAQVLRNRWYWRDERVARLSRSWRLSFQPLTSSWRVSLGGLSQTFATLSEALAPLSRVTGWRLAEPGQLDAGGHYYVEFEFRLDTTQLPRPMQIDLGGDWKLGIERSVKLD